MDRCHKLCKISYSRKQKRSSDSCIPSAGAGTRGRGRSPVDGGAQAPLGGRPGRESGNSRSHFVLLVEDGRDDILHLAVARPRHPVDGLPQRGEGSVDVEPQRLLDHPHAEQVPGPAGGEERSGAGGGSSGDTRAAPRPCASLPRDPGPPGSPSPRPPAAEDPAPGHPPSAPAEHAPDLLHAVPRHGGGRASPSNAATLATACPSTRKRKRRRSRRQGAQPTAEGRRRPGSASRWPSGGSAGSCVPPLDLKGQRRRPPRPPPAPTRTRGAGARRLPPRLGSPAVAPREAEGHGDGSLGLVSPQGMAMAVPGPRTGLPGWAWPPSAPAREGPGVPRPVESHLSSGDLCHHVTHLREVAAVRGTPTPRPCPYPGLGPVPRSVLPPTVTCRSVLYPSMPVSVCPAPHRALVGTPPAAGEAAAPGEQGPGRWARPW